MKVTLTDGCWTLQWRSLLKGYFKEILLKVTKCIFVRSIPSNAQALTVSLGGCSDMVTGRPARQGRPPFQTSFFKLLQGSAIWILVVAQGWGMKVQR